MSWPSAILSAPACSGSSREMLSLRSFNGRSVLHLGITLAWNWKDLGISPDAKNAADKLGLVPTEIFAHPEVVAKNATLLRYYRLLACLPAKGLAQIRKKSAKGSRVQDICILLN